MQSTYWGTRGGLAQPQAEEKILQGSILFSQQYDVANYSEVQSYKCIVSHVFAAAAMYAWAERLHCLLACRACLLDSMSTRVCIYVHLPCRMLVASGTRK